MKINWSENSLRGFRGFRGGKSGPIHKGAAPSVPPGGVLDTVLLCWAGHLISGQRPHTWFPGTASCLTGWWPWRSVPQEQNLVQSEDSGQQGGVGRSRRVPLSELLPTRRESRRTSQPRHETLDKRDTG